MDGLCRAAWTRFSISQTFYGMPLISSGPGGAARPGHRGRIHPCLFCMHYHRGFFFLCSWPPTLLQPLYPLGGLLSAYRHIFCLRIWWPWVPPLGNWAVLPHGPTLSHDSSTQRSKKGHSGTVIVHKVGSIDGEEVELAAKVSHWLEDGLISLSYNKL